MKFGKGEFRHNQDGVSTSPTIPPANVKYMRRSITN